jgi:hypothetical protein
LVAVALASLDMAKKSNTDFFSSLRSQGLRKSVAKALAELETRGPEARAAAEKVARSVANDLRSAADTIEKRLDVDRADAGTGAAKKAASTQKRGATTRRATPKKGATSGAGSTAKKTASTQKRGATTRSPTPKKSATTRASSTAKKSS